MNDHVELIRAHPSSSSSSPNTKSSSSPLSSTTMTLPAPRQIYKILAGLLVIVAIKMVSNTSFSHNQRLFYLENASKVDKKSPVREKAASMQRPDDDYYMAQSTRGRDGDNIIHNKYNPQTSANKINTNTMMGDKEAALMKARQRHANNATNTKIRHNQNQNWGTNNKNTNNGDLEMEIKNRLEDDHASQSQKPSGRWKKRKHAYNKLRNPHISRHVYDWQKPTSPPLKVPYPILVMNLPKSGTTTLWHYFECGLGKDHAVHWWTEDTKKNLGPCLKHNIDNQNPPLQQCGDFDVWLDMGFVQGQSFCFFPQVMALESLYHAYPNATWLLVERDVDSWFHSASNWGGMLQRWKGSCRSAFFSHLPRTQALTDDDYKQAYLDTNQKVRQFAREHPSLTYLEPPPAIKLSSPRLGTWLEQNVGIEAKCWGKCQPKGTSAKCD